MSYVVFKTDTLLDIRAITMFGLNAKPNSKSPIGYFGTGLKYAISTIIRHNIPVQIWIGNIHYTFEKRPEEFRDQPFEQIWMKRHGSLLAPFQHQPLPFTIFLGKNWELWQAFRELYANTLDEGGDTFEVLEGLFLDRFVKDNRTLIVVGDSNAITPGTFSEVFRDRDTIFLPEGKRTPDVDVPGIQVFHQPSEYLYYRGMRVQKLDKPSIMTYNVLANQELTEDRTLKEPWWVQYQLTTFLGHSTDRALINHFLNATEDHWESTWNFDIQAPGATFVECLQARRRQEIMKRASEGPRISSYRTPEPIYRSSRMAAVIEKAAPPTPAAPETRLWWHFDQWLTTYATTSVAEYKLLNAVLKDLKESDSEYGPNAPEQLDVPEVVLERRVPLQEEDPF